MKEALLSLTTEQSRLLAIYPDSDCTGFPPALTDFLDAIKKIAMPCRGPRDDVIAGTPDQEKIKERLITLEGAFTQGMKEKKQHEVAQLATLIETVNSDFEHIPAVVDVGAGKGWVGQVLTYKMGMDVINLEGNPCHNDEANDRCIEVQKRLHAQTQRRERHAGNPVQEFVSKPAFNAHFFLDFGIDVNLFESEIASAVDKIALWKEQQAQNTSQPRKESTRSMICLHGCGDLSASVLHTFSRWDNCVTLVNVGCCYHKLSISALKKQKNDRSFVNLFNLASLPSSQTTNSLYSHSSSTPQATLSPSPSYSVAKLTPRGSELFAKYYSSEKSHDAESATQPRAEVDDKSSQPSCGCSGNSDIHERKVFPMSNLFQSLLAKYDLGNLDGLLQLATKCAFGFSGITDAGLTIKGDFLYYRGLLQLLLEKYLSPLGVTWYVRRMKSQNKGKDFETYIKNALDSNLRLDLHPEGMGDACKPEEIISDWFDLRDNVLKPALREMYSQFSEYQKFVTPFMAIECALSRIVESLLNMDRYMFLKEQGTILFSIVNFYPLLLSKF
eukprot:TRINITY_DN3325_c0_g1_i1.p1 TRINITY_DN3325_c0_g1~~TRINITY_DN3325_c0_g1_i1.p1  ORF type:complete len:620 (-),score=118.10 TRINITY_DN3325_c0_g1_i1:43-1713(-)